MTIEAISSAPLRSHVAETLHQKSQRRRYVLLLQKREVKDYCVGLIKNVLFCLQFFPRLLSLHPLSEVSTESQLWVHRSDETNAENELEENREARKMRGWPTMAKTQRRDGYD